MNGQNLDIARLAALANILVQEGEGDVLEQTLRPLLALLDSLPGLPPGQTGGPAGMVSALRPDTVAASLPQKVVLQNAAAQQDGYFLAPAARQ